MSPAVIRRAILDTLLPGRGSCYAARNVPPSNGEAKGQWRQQELDTAKALADFLDLHSARAETYVALATFAPGKGRTKDAVIGKNCISADIDDKLMPGDTPEERHTNSSRLAGSVPAPTVLVDSGGGFHVHLRLPEGDRVQEFEDRAEGVAHVERLAAALRRFIEAKAKELLGVEVKLDPTHGAERVWRVPPGVNCKAGDGAKVLTADKALWRNVELVGRAEGLADTPPADLEFLAPFLTDDTGSHARSGEFDLSLLPPKLRDAWPMPSGDQSGHDFAVAAALVEADHPPSVVEDAIRARRAELPRAEDRAKGARDDYVRRTVDKAFAAAQARPSAADIPHTPRPQPPQDVDPAALHGLAGDFVQAVLPHSESSLMSLLSQLLIGFGNLIGRKAHFRAESDYHYTNLFGVLVGETAKGRKGSSWGHVERVLRMVESAWKSCVKSGLSSGEGLIWQIRDPIYKKSPVKKKGRVVDYEDVLADEGVDDKRLLVYESEFATALRVIGRDGNTLSAIVRNAWDGRDLSSLTKNSPARATGPQVSIVGHITRNELNRYLTSTEAGNGFGNRFLWFWVFRSKLLPEGGRVPDELLEALAIRLREAVAFAGTTGQVARDDRARQLWRDVYPELSEGRPGLLGAMTGRAEPQVMRLATVYALLDLSPTIRKEHLQAALAVWRYSEASARYIFGERLGDPTADEALRALRANPKGLTRTQLRDHFQRHAKADELIRALESLRELGLARHEYRDTGGRRAEVWFATNRTCDGSDRSDKSLPAPDPSVALDASVAGEDDEVPSQEADQEPDDDGMFREHVV